ncbi:unnamed protein product [Linum trigynum]|uniref:Reverse transcriptase RNase H-like domain-containing protein n=1 Tax=Linum trigynum TaxID=586398 RepID=A0AAV2CB20_9ROSI
MWRPYLLSQKFHIYTDHQSLRNLLEQRVSTLGSGVMMMSAERDGTLFPPTAAGGSYEFFDLFREDGFLKPSGIDGGEGQNQESMMNALGLPSLLSDEMAHLEAATTWESAQE